MKRASADERSVVLTHPEPGLGGTMVAVSRMAMSHGVAPEVQEELKAIW